MGNPITVNSFETLLVQCGCLLTKCWRVFLGRAGPLCGLEVVTNYIRVVTFELLKFSSLLLEVALRRTHRRNEIYPVSELLIGGLKQLATSYALVLCEVDTVLEALEMLEQCWLLGGNLLETAPVELINLPMGGVNHIFDADDCLSFRALFGRVSP